MASRTTIASRIDVSASSRISEASTAKPRPAYRHGPPDAGVEPEEFRAIGQVGDEADEAGELADAGAEVAQLVGASRHPLAQAAERGQGVVGGGARVALQRRDGRRGLLQPGREAVDAAVEVAGDALRLARRRAGVVARVQDVGHERLDRGHHAGGRGVDHRVVVGGGRSNGDEVGTCSAPRAPREHDAGGGPEHEAGEREEQGVHARPSARAESSLRRSHETPRVHEVA